MRASRLDVRSVPCPECKAEVNAPCKGARDRARLSNHQSRASLWAAWRDALEAVAVFRAA